MSTAIFPFLLGGEYGEGFQHATASSEMGGGRQVTAALIGSTGRFAAAGGLRIPQGASTYATFAAFVAARRGGYDTFLYLPVFDTNGQSASEAVGTGDGSTTRFALDYKYPKTGTFTVTVAGNAKVEGVDWSLSDSDGNSWSAGETPYIKFTYGTPSLAQAIVATYSFHVPVRFADGDNLMALLGVRSQKSTGAASVFRLGTLSLVQDYPGSHLVTVPAV